MQNGPHSQSRDSLSDRLTSRDSRHAEPQDFCHEKSSLRNQFFANESLTHRDRGITPAGSCRSAARCVQNRRRGLWGIFKKVRGRVLGLCLCLIIKNLQMLIIMQWLPSPFSNMQLSVTLHMGNYPPPHPPGNKSGL